MKHNAVTQQKLETLLNDDRLEAHELAESITELAHQASGGLYDPFNAQGTNKKTNLLLTLAKAIDDNNEIHRKAVLALINEEVIDLNLSAHGLSPGSDSANSQAVMDWGFDNLSADHFIDHLVYSGKAQTAATILRSHREIRFNVQAPDLLYTAALTHNWRDLITTFEPKNRITLNANRKTYYTIDESSFTARSDFEDGWTPRKAVPESFHNPEESIYDEYDASHEFDDYLIEEPFEPSKGQLKPLTSTIATHHPLAFYLEHNASPNKIHAQAIMALQSLSTPEARFGLFNALYELEVRKPELSSFITDLAQLYPAEPAAHQKDTLLSQALSNRYTPERAARIIISNEDPALSTPQGLSQAYLWASEVHATDVLDHLHEQAQNMDVDVTKFAHKQQGAFHHAYRGIYNQTLEAQLNTSRAVNTLQTLVNHKQDLGATDGFKSPYEILDTLPQGVVLPAQVAAKNAEIIQVANMHQLTEQLPKAEIQRLTETDEAKTRVYTPEEADQMIQNYIESREGLLKHKLGMHGLYAISGGTLANTAAHLMSSPSPFITTLGMALPALGMAFVKELQESDNLINTLDGLKWDAKYALKKMGRGSTPKGRRERAHTKLAHDGLEQIQGAVSDGRLTEEKVFAALEVPAQDNNVSATPPDEAPLSLNAKVKMDFAEGLKKTPSQAPERI